MHEKRIGDRGRRLMPPPVAGCIVFLLLFSLQFSEGPLRPASVPT